MFKLLKFCVFFIIFIDKFIEGKKFSILTLFFYVCIIFLERFIVSISFIMSMIGNFLTCMFCNLESFYNL